MKSMASAILESTGPLAKFPRTIFFSMKAGISQKLRDDGRESKPSRWANALFNSAAFSFVPFLYLFAVQVWLKIVVSLNELHSISECTLGDLCVYSANFCARNPPSEAPNRWTWRLKTLVLHFVIIVAHFSPQRPSAADDHRVSLSV